MEQQQYSIDERVRPSGIDCCRWEIEYLLCSDAVALLVILKKLFERKNALTLQFSVNIDENFFSPQNEQTLALTTHKIWMH